MTDADRELLEALAGWLDMLFHGADADAATLRRLLAELDAVTAERDALQLLVVEQAKEE